MCVAGFHVNLDRCVPVVIGTVPLLMTELPNALAQPNPPSAPFAEPAASAPLPYYMDPSIGEFSQLQIEQISNFLKNIRKYAIFLACMMQRRHHIKKPCKAPTLQIIRTPSTFIFQLCHLRPDIRRFQCSRQWHNPLIRNQMQHNLWFERIKIFYLVSFNRA